MKFKKIKVRVKTLKEIEECSQGIYMPSNMKIYCDKVIELEGWNGDYGNYEGWCWDLPMLSEFDIKEHNRNGANS